VERRVSEVLHLRCRMREVPHMHRSAAPKHACKIRNTSVRPSVVADGWIRGLLILKTYFGKKGWAETRWL